MQSFRISGRNTCISPVGRPFLHLGQQNLNVGAPFSPVGRAVYYFTTLLFHFHWVPNRKFLHLGPQNLNVGPPFSPVGWPVLHLGPQKLNVGPPFSPVGRTVYYFTVLLFPLGARQEVFASWAAKPECRTSPRSCFASRTAFLCMSAHGFACRPNVSPRRSAGPWSRSPQPRWSHPPGLGNNQGRAGECPIPFK